MKKTVVRPAVFEDGVCNKRTGARARGVRVEDARWERPGLTRLEITASAERFVDAVKQDRENVDVT